MKLHVTQSNDERATARPRKGLRDRSDASRTFAPRQQPHPVVIYLARRRVPAPPSSTPLVLPVPTAAPERPRNARYDILDVMRDEVRKGGRRSLL